jgi:hypothetical protein
MVQFTPPSINQVLKAMLLGLVVLFFLVQFINFAAIGSDDENAQVFKEDVDYASVVPNTIGMLIVAIAMWLVWVVSMRASAERFDKKYLITIIVAGILLYFLYAKILQPALAANGVTWLPNLNFAAYQLQSVIKP